MIRKQLKSLADLKGRFILDSGVAVSENTYYTYMLFEDAYILLRGDCYYDISIEDDYIPAGFIVSDLIADEEREEYNSWLKSKDELELSLIF